MKCYAAAFEGFKSNFSLCFNDSVVLISCFLKVFEAFTLRQHTKCCKAK